MSLTLRVRGWPSAFIATVLAGCGSDGPAAAGWAGTVDTLETGIVQVTNPVEGMWGETPPWQIVEEVRIGTMDGTGPNMFGGIGVIDVDAAGRMFVFERQAQELRIFDSDGSHVRTVGRKGGGPGEFEQVIGMDWGPDGNLWMIDPGNSRIAVYDTSGALVENHVTLGGFVISPWPGGFDDRGRFYTYGIDREAEDGFGMVLVRYDEALQPSDTLEIPQYPGEREFFELRSENGFMRTGVPFTPSLTWQFVRRSHFVWFALTGDYHLYQRTLDGDTVRIVSREFDRIPVTGTDVDSAIARLEWFVNQGGKIDRSKIPDVKPAIREFFVDDAGYLWVAPVVAEDRRGRVLDVFDPEGRYLGALDLPFELQSYPRPIFRGEFIYGVTQDELEVPFVVRARIRGRTPDDRGASRELIGG